MKKENDIKRNILFNTIGSVFYCVCQWFLTILVVRLDSLETSGYLSLAMTTSSSFSAITLFGMRNFQVSDVKEEFSSKEYYGSRIITCTISLIACMLYAVAMTESFYNFGCITLFMLIRLAEGFADVFHGINQKHNRFDLIGTSYILRGIFSVLSFTVGLVLTHNLLVTLLVMAILNLLIIVVFDRWKTGELEDIKPVVWSKHIVKLLIGCVPLVIFSFLLSMENLIPKNLLEKMYGANELGIYASIASPTLVVQVMATVVFNPFLPGFTKLYTDGNYNKFQKVFHRILLVLVGMALVVVLGANLLGRFGLKLLFGKMILEYYYLFNPIVWCTILTAMIWVVSAIVIAIRQIKSLLVGIVVSFGLCVSIAQPLIERYGKNGVSVVQIIAYAVLVVYMIIICEVKIIREKRGVAK